MDSMTVYITKTGKKMHYSPTCYTLLNSIYKTDVTLRQANQLGYDKCKICASSDLLLSEMVNYRQMPFKNKLHYYLDQSVRSNRQEISKVNNQIDNDEVIGSHYYIPYDSIKKSNSNYKKNLGFDNNDLKEMCLMSESIICGGNRNSFLKQENSLSISIIPKQSIQQESIKRNDMQKAYEIKKEINENIIIEALEDQGKGKGMSVIGKRSNTYTNNDSVIQLNLSQTNQRPNESFSSVSSYSLSKSNIIQRIKSIDYSIDINNLSKNDLISIPKSDKKIIFFQIIIKPKISRATCRLGLDIISFNKEDRIDDTETITKVYDIDQLTIVNITCDKTKKQFYIKYKIQGREKWHYTNLKYITNNYEDKMIRPIIVFNEDEITKPKIHVYKQVID